jgi:GTP cyclohydrolase I
VIHELEDIRHAKVHAVAAPAVKPPLEALGVDLRDESLRETPGRGAAHYGELFSPEAFDATTFPTTATTTSW